MTDKINLQDNEKINEPFKLKCLQEANAALHINDSLKKIIFVYSKPKVGSTSLVTSLRIFASTIFNIIHIHDEEMLKVLGNIHHITVNEIILYNKMIGKEVYVIDIYRSPIERKISTFFEKINTYHFNSSIEQLSQFKIERFIERFNKIFPYIGNGDNFLDIYDHDKPAIFPYSQKYLSIEDTGIKYIKLRLKDSDEWSYFLEKELNIRIKIIRDYESVSKPIKTIYKLFKEQYKIPANYLKNIETCRYFNYYYSPIEKNEYLKEWSNKLAVDFVAFTPNEFKIYEYLCVENNNHTAFVQLNHYLDEGCICKACQVKRNTIIKNILKGDTNIPRILHEDAKKEFIKKNNIKKYLNTKIPATITNMSTIVGAR